jgi:hypothetical protein
MALFEDLFKGGNIVADLLSESERPFWRRS